MRDGELCVEAFAIQDSSMLSILAKADALIVRAPNAAAAKAGDSASVLLLE
jgi:molybdopterin molybdotransferase